MAAGRLLVLIVLALVIAHCMGGPEGPNYATSKVERGRLVTTVSATGNLAPTNQVTVGSQLSGQIIKVLVDVNDRVTKGQVLAEIDPEQLNDEIRQGQATLRPISPRWPQPGHTGGKPRATGASGTGLAAVGRKSPLADRIADRARRCAAGQAAMAQRRPLSWPAALRWRKAGPSGPAR